MAIGSGAKSRDGHGRNEKYPPLAPPAREGDQCERNRDVDLPRLLFGSHDYSPRTVAEITAAQAS